MDRHAYLIMAHGQYDLLGMELELLDHVRNDFFIHIDKSSSCDREAIRRHVRLGRVFFTPQVRVCWGGSSQIATTLVLLRTAVQTGQYAFYHLLSGVDLPLKPQTKILEFYDAHPGEQFLSMGGKPLPEQMLSRIRYYYPTQNLFKSRASVPGRALRKLALAGQKLLRVNRIRLDPDKIDAGSAFFDITDDFARYVVSREAWIWKHFKASFCADELFLQTLFLHWEGEHRRHRSNAPKHPYIHSIYLDVMRAIDWERGNPYVWQEEDLNMLLSSDCLFARKFDYACHPQIVDALCAHIRENKQ